MTGHDLFALADRAAADGGFTYRLSTGTHPKAGFAVSPDKGPEPVLPSAPTATDLLTFLSDHWATVIVPGQVVFKGGVCLGCWHNSVTGKWYLDISIVVPTLDEALVLGRANNQLAVFNLSEGQSIAVPYFAPPVEVAS